VKSVQKLAFALFLLTDTDLVLVRFHFFPGFPVKTRRRLFKVAADIGFLRQHYYYGRVTWPTWVLNAVLLGVGNRHALKFTTGVIPWHVGDEQQDG
jgi:hypothetical protein